MTEKRPIIALDFATQDEAAQFLAGFPKNEALFVKIGMELFYQTGPAIVTWLKGLGHDVFLDLKLHDIPNTVGQAMKGIAKLGVSITNVHAAGGVEMMQAAKAGLKAGTIAGQAIPKLIAVTQLTSTSEVAMRRDQLIEVPLIESVKHYATRTAEAGLDGVVCSALEVAAIKSVTPSGFFCLTPGIRPQSAAIGDQKRVVTPSQARRIGSDYIVVGRPITQAENPYQSYLEIQAELQSIND
ncbi:MULTISPECIES: orotidine-5'-phosphate decarboxylase [unclassified Enterococcus]|uniref:orotidine-5'-phosphate decarboxylase n=1 Tax=unclassified Enterococcus TaxID=2608891 RepID=UPI001556E7D6|nr:MULTISPECIES: orotidine-5'-phosphate decarboxylase [unclassified Enterococcus]MBS7576596.1 orotidine-5'-phosphate decarboxylase [Enterococcus sp. MMGLQ5-2]MBS7583917.1 orotidine-5'-phosphate decarboxylase [Enterococcus sp. MMGLQ5-1]NPD11778.1 orotidine-5'-phosphate decarboxylase [Enterococcus sp. MMGLQ5-1]NPD36433.1 orotidine-5'-phosphate decarboxylase [Enterococcus sp. MMGLQ5-2]